MRKIHSVSCCFALLSTIFASAMPLLAQSRSDIVVPGTGVQLNQVGDDFEDETWDFIPNNPKSTEDIDENQRQGPNGGIQILLNGFRPLQVVFPVAKVRCS
jgi:hypothetical protein